MDTRFDLDTQIASMCDDAQAWLMLAALPEGIAAMLPRLHTGYMPKGQRNAVAAGLYRMGVRKPPARETAADRARAEAFVMILSSTMFRAMLDMFGPEGQVLS